ncbi:MAG TPA: hypothetical protein VNS33_09085, partial [Bradyrhizobium sp.]|nr:hypothetical protein [Bradyrhizobium sp.]
MEHAISPDAKLVKSRACVPRRSARNHMHKMSAWRVQSSLQHLAFNISIGAISGPPKTGRCPWRADVAEL